MIPVSRFLAALDEVLERVQLQPLEGSPYHRNYRWMKMKRYRYTIYYQPVADSPVKVFAIAHASRKPGYWLRRTRKI